MIKLFEKNIGLQVVLIVLATLILWVPVLVAPASMPEGDGTAPLYDLLYQWLGGSPRIATIVAIVLILSEGVALNLLLSNVGLSSQTSLLPTLLYIVVMSASASTLTPMVLANGVLIACLSCLMLRNTLLTISTNNICWATAFIGLSTLFYLPMWMIMISYLLIAINYRLYSWKDWVAMLLGLLAPFVLLSMVLYLSDNLTDHWTIIWERIIHPLPRFDTGNTLMLVGNGFLLILLIVSVVAMWLHLGEHTVLWQKNASTVMLLVVGGIAMLFYSQIFPADLQPFALQFVFCATHYLAQPRKSVSGYRQKNRHWIYDILLLFTLIAAIIC